MADSYIINEYTYKAVGGLKMAVFARTRETAEEIIKIVNTDTDPDFIFKPKRFFGVKKVSIKVPPYELEQEQLEAAESQLEYRRKHKQKI